MSKQEINKDSLLAMLARMALNDPKVSTKDAVEAQRILKSIKDTKPKLNYNSTALQFQNPELNTNVSLGKTSKGATDISFMTESGFDRPDKPNTKAQQLGIRAAINQAIDEIPMAGRNNKKNSKSYYTFQAISDDGDLKKKGGKSFGTADNQRSKLYRRFSKGAMNAIDNKTSGLDPKGYGQRIGDSTFQPRMKGGRLGKYVEWNLAEPVTSLNNIARQVSNPLRIISNVANRAHPLLLAGDLIQQDSKKVRTANTDVFDSEGNLTALGRRGLPPTSHEQYGPPDPKPKTNSELVIKAPAKKNTAVLSKKGGKTGSSINGVFFPHNWSAEQRMRYAARGGK